MRRPFLEVLPLALAPLLAASCAGPQAAATDRHGAPLDLPALRAMIEANNARFTRAHVTGDVATIDAMFTRDATSFPPGAEPSVGLAAIHDLTVEYLEAGIHEFRETTTDFYGCGELLIDQGEYVVVYGTEPVVERGKYLNVWVQEDGAWRIRANIWNTSPSATAPE